MWMVPTCTRNEDTELRQLLLLHYRLPRFPRVQRGHHQLHRADPGDIKGVFHRRGHYEMVEKAGLYWHFVDLVWVFVFNLLPARLALRDDIIEFDAHHSEAGRKIRKNIWMVTLLPRPPRWKGQAARKSVFPESWSMVKLGYIVLTP